MDTNKALLDRVCELAHTEYQKDHETDVSLRIVADHVKSCTFMISCLLYTSRHHDGIESH